MEPTLWISVALHAVDAGLKRLRFGAFEFFGAGRLIGTVGKTITPAESIATNTIDPVNLVPLTISFLIVLLIIGLSIAYWATAIRCWMRREALFPSVETHPIPAWGLVDLLTAVASLFVVATSCTWMLHRFGWAPQPINQGPASSWQRGLLHGLQLLAIPLSVFLIAMRCKISPLRLGWATSRLGSDIRLGFRAFIMFFPATMILMALATFLTKQKYSHPIIESFQKDPSTLLVAIVMAVIFAPILEEFCFRVLLQGYLQSMAEGKLSLKSILLGRTQQEPHAESPASLESNETTTAAIVDAPPAPAENQRFDNPFQFTGTQQSNPDNLNRSQANLSYAYWWPIALSGLLFGLAHFGYGMSWIPLTFLGMVLGWLYRVTNRIWPSMVVHMAVNGFTMLNLTLVALLGDPTKLSQ